MLLVKQLDGDEELHGAICQQHGLSRKCVHLRSVLVHDCQLAFYGKRLASFELLYAVPATRIAARIDELIAPRILHFRVNGENIRKPEQMLSFAFSLVVHGTHPKCHLLANLLTARILEHEYWVLKDAALSQWSLHNALVHGLFSVYQQPGGSIFTPFLLYRNGVKFQDDLAEMQNKVCCCVAFPATSHHIFSPLKNSLTSSS